MKTCRTCKTEFDAKGNYSYCPGCRNWRYCKECGVKFKYSFKNRRRTCPSCVHSKYKTPCVDCGKPVFHGSDRCNRCHNKKHFDKGGTYINGYKMVKRPTHARSWPNGYIYEHIVVMENKLERNLVSNENIQHLNGIRHDNRPENLELWVKPQPTGIRASDAVKWAQEVLERYAPELLNGGISVSAEDGANTLGQYQPGPPEDFEN